VILLDAYALVAFVNGEPAASEVEALLRGKDAGITVLNLGEAIDVSQRTYQSSPADVANAVEPLLDRGLRVVALGVEHAWRAAELRLHHYRRRSRELSIADCFLLAAAARGDNIATADPAVADVAHLEDIGLIGLPDSRGRRP
jgi:predicted nucleic acid-binding protein